MKATRRVAGRPVPAGWDVSTEIRHHGRVIVPGTELSITGVPGRYRFVRHVAAPTDAWVDVVGGTRGREMTRSFRPDRIKTVHRIRKSVKG